jgi:DNA-binding NtrC family response regulator
MKSNCVFRADSASDKAHPTGNFVTLRTILLVHREHQTREMLAAALRSHNERVVLEAGSLNEAMEILNSEKICILISELFLPDKSGLQLLRQAREINPGITTLISVPTGDRTAIKTVLQAGVFSYINEPFDSEEAVIMVARAINFHERQSHQDLHVRKFRKRDGYNGIVGQSRNMQKLFSMLAKVAEDDQSTVLILGETGTGKELAARAIHAQGNRKQKNFVPVNCAAIPDELLESELFGYVQGAFTGAAKSKIGRIQYAQGGTLFLDEIGDMKPALQSKLLRVLQEREFEPVGSVKPVPADIRVIAATHQDLNKAVAEGRFREDLFYRINVFPVTIPPLRERCEDIPLLMEKFTDYFNRGKEILFNGFDAHAVKILTDYHWPGNVRELENLVQRMSILCRGGHAQVADLPEQYRQGTISGESRQLRPELQTHHVEFDLAGSIDFEAVMNDVETRLITQALQYANGNKKEAAERLNLKRTTFLQKLKKRQI